VWTVRPICSDSSFASLTQADEESVALSSALCSVLAKSAPGLNVSPTRSSHSPSQQNHSQYCPLPGGGRRGDGRAQGAEQATLGQ
jgi:hypothetical protein